MGGLRLHVAGGNGFPHKHDSGCMAAHGALPGGEPQKEAISSCIHTLVRRPSHLYLGRHRHVTRNAPSCSGGSRRGGRLGGLPVQPLGFHACSASEEVGPRAQQVEVCVVRPFNEDRFTLADRGSSPSDTLQPKSRGVQRGLRATLGCVDTHNSTRLLPNRNRKLCAYNATSANTWESLSHQAHAYTPTPSKPRRGLEASHRPSYRVHGFQRCHPSRILACAGDPSNPRVSRGRSPSQG